MPTHTFDPEAPYANDAGRCPLLELLDTAWQGIGDRIGHAERLGASWTRESTPFVHVEDGRPVSHAGVLLVPMVLEGAPVDVAWIHAVCTHPERRGRGHARRVIERAIEHAELHTSTLLLGAGEPELYERFGFRALREVASTVHADPIGPRRGRLRRLAEDEPEDVALVHRLLSQRSAISRRAGTREPGWLLLVNECLRRNGFSRLRYADELDALLVVEIRASAAGPVLRLIDVAAPRLPRLAALLRCFDEDFALVELGFHPDRLETEFVAHATLATPDTLMVRGRFPPESVPFRLPELAWC